MINPIFTFLKELKINNNREWFHANKPLYQEAKKEMESLVDTLIPGIARFDSSVKHITARESLFRIFRDIRFSKDKSPYKTNFGAWISKNGRKSCGPGYYLHLEPGASFLAVGVYMPDPDSLKKIRQEILYNVDVFKKILNSSKTQKHTTGLDEMDKLKRPPKDFPADFPDIEILKNKHYILSQKVDDKQVMQEDFPQWCINVFKDLYPFNQFLEKALEP
jgi:uncharacterized protein (TIGR02453 family)